MSSALLTASLSPRLGPTAWQAARIPSLAGAPLRQAAWRHREQRCCRKLPAVEAQRGGAAPPSRGQLQQLQATRIDMDQLVDDYLLPAVGLFSLPFLLVGVTAKIGLLACLFVAGQVACAVQYVQGVPGPNAKMDVASWFFADLIIATAFQASNGIRMTLLDAQQLGGALAFICCSLLLTAAVTAVLKNRQAGASVGGSANPNGAVGVEADGNDEWHREQQEREQELREFDKLLCSTADANRKTKSKAKSKRRREN